jgi:hypothetical protein
VASEPHCASAGLAGLPEHLRPGAEVGAPLRVTESLGWK